MQKRLLAQYRPPIRTKTYQGFLRICCSILGQLAIWSRVGGARYAAGISPVLRGVQYGTPTQAAHARPLDNLAADRVLERCRTLMSSIAPRLPPSSPGLYWQAPARALRRAPLSLLLLRSNR